jgi:hypothetical protein
MTQDIAYMGATSNKITGVSMGGRTSSAYNKTEIDQVTIASTGNATDFGDLTAGGSYTAGASSGHGGLS